MKGLIQLTLRELVARRQVFLLAAIIAPLPFLLPFLPALKSYDPTSLRATSALALAAGFTVALSLILGATVIGRDLSEKRFGFYFSRPLSGLTVWAGKMTGVLILIASVVLIVLLPTFLGTLLPGADAARGHGVFLEVFKAPAMALSLFCVALLIGLAYTLSILARAQSAWIILPLAVGIAAASVAWHSAIPLGLIGSPMFISILLLLGGLLVSLYAAGLFQVLLGRADLKRGARVLALALSGGLLISASVHAGYSAWIRSAEPQDLYFIDEAMAGGEGSWVYLSGQVKRGGTSYSQSFLFNTDSKHWLRTDVPWRGANTVAFTPDGRRVVWLQYVARSWGRDLAAQIWTVDLGEAENQPEQVLELDQWVRNLALSADGERLALVIENDLQVFDLDSGQMLATTRTCRDLRYHRVMFQSPNLVRFYRMALPGEMAGLYPDLPEGQDDRGGVVIAEFDVARGDFHRTGFIPNAANGLYRASWSRDTKRMTIQKRDEDNGSIYLHDGRTGESISRLDQGNWSFSDSAHLLFDGRIAILRRVEDSTELVLYSPEGTVLRTIRIAEGWGTIHGEVAPGLLALRVTRTLSKKPKVQLQTECYLANLDDGDCRLLGREVRPVIGSGRGVAGIFGAWPSPGSPGSSLYIEDHSSLVRLDPVTGERSVILELDP